MRKLKFKLTTKANKMSNPTDKEIDEEIEKLIRIKRKLSDKAPEMVTPEIVAAIYRELATADRSFFANADKY
ncbi:hypothetical protein J4061_004476 [Salmonella enterica]|nr:hypothetical protein [Salmonella enterica]